MIPDPAFLPNQPKGADWGGIEEQEQTKHMNLYRKYLYWAAVLGFSATLLSNCAHEPVTQMNAANASASEIRRESKRALSELYSQNPAARKLGNKAAGVLVFPHIVKGGFVVGAEGGNGALINRDQTVSKYYQTAGASYGLQAGVQKFGYALFLMQPSDVRKLDEADGWEVGSSPTLVVVDQGMSTSLTTKTVQKGTYAFFFNQRGLMAGLGLKGTKITRIHPGQ